LPAGIATQPFQAAPSGTTEPQVPQKARCMPGLDAHRTMRSAPCVRRKLASGTATYVA
jgi:hypothetical protein